MVASIEHMFDRCLGVCDDANLLPWGDDRVVRLLRRGFPRLCRRVRHVRGPVALLTTHVLVANARLKSYTVATTAVAVNQ